MKLLEPKFRRIVRLMAIPVVVIFALSIAAMASGSMSLSYGGMAVDEGGRLYLSRGSQLEVYEDGTLEQTVRLASDESYVTFVRADGQQMTVLLTGEEPPADTGGQTLTAQKHSCTAPDGTVYTLHREMLAAQVTAEDGTVLYAEPAWANALKPLLALAALYVIFAAGYIALDRFATLEATGHLDQV